MTPHDNALDCLWKPTISLVMSWRRRHGTYAMTVPWHALWTACPVMKVRQGTYAITINTYLALGKQMSTCGSTAVLATRGGDLGTRCPGLPIIETRTFKRRATIEVAVFGRNIFSVTGLLNPKSFEIKSCVEIFFVVCLSHGIFHRVANLFSSEICFWEVWSSWSEEPQKKVLHLYPSMPHNAVNKYRCRHDPLDMSALTCVDFGPTTSTLGIMCIGVACAQSAVCWRRLCYSFQDYCRYSTKFESKFTASMKTIKTRWPHTIRTPCAFCDKRWLRTLLGVWQDFLPHTVFACRAIATFPQWSWVILFLSVKSKPLSVDLLVWNAVNVEYKVTVFLKRCTRRKQEMIKYLMNLGIGLHDYRDRKRIRYDILRSSKWSNQSESIFSLSLPTPSLSQTTFRQSLDLTCGITHRPYHCSYIRVLYELPTRNWIFVWFPSFVVYTRI